MKTQFDKIYVTSLITNRSRQNHIKKQMKDLNLDFEFIYGIDYMNIVKDSLNHDFIRIPYLFGRETKEQNNSLYGDLACYGCTMSHYQAVLQAYEFGYNNVLIIEDDACFIKNKNLIEYYLNNIPSDADFITFDPRFIYLGIGSSEMNEMQNELKTRNTEYFKISKEYTLLCGAMMYGIMNRESMKLYLNNQRKALYMSDQVQGFFKNPTVTRYVAKKCIIIDQYNYIFNFPQESKSYTNNYKASGESLTVDMFNKPDEYLITNLNSINGLQDIYDKKFNVKTKHIESIAKRNFVIR